VRNQIVFYLNGKRHNVAGEQAGMMLADYLRYDQALTGTKVVCAEGDCGACSVLRYFPHITGTDSDNYIAINSCITPVATLDASSLLTVESLKDGERLHEAQRSMVDSHGSQCGFCTPGFVMALTGLVEEKLSKKQKDISDKEAKNCLTGNLCRCTGYQAIIDAATKVDLKKEKTLKDRYFDKAQASELKDAYSKSVLVETSNFSFFAPKTMKEAVDYLVQNPDTRIIASSTDLGVVHNKRKINLTKLLSLHLIDELYKVGGSSTIRLGARVTMTEFRHFIKDKVPEIAKYLDIFASPQIKNIATIIGNIANASPIGDMPPIFLALGASITFHGKKGERKLPLSEFFLDYRKTAKASDEIITGLEFELPGKNTSFKAFKNSNRKDLDISAMNMVIQVDWQDDKKEVVKDIRIAAGGIAATPLRLKKTEDTLRGQKIDQKLLEKICSEVHQEFTPLSDLRASSSYRRVLVENYLMRFFKQEVLA
tara:strand:+ start:8204 stop:9652 length:1449 start_codon:yes stop_codon:yes gene_type:complete